MRDFFWDGFEKQAMTDGQRKAVGYTGAAVGLGAGVGGYLNAKSLAAGTPKGTKMHNYANFLRIATPLVGAAAAAAGISLAHRTKTAAGAARVDRMLKALGKRKLPAGQVHGALRGLDLKNQVRGINPNVETSVLKAKNRVATVQGSGGFSGTPDSVVAPPVGGHT